MEISLAFYADSSYSIAVSRRKRVALAILTNLESSSKRKRFRFSSALHRAERSGRQSGYSGMIRHNPTPKGGSHASFPPQSAPQQAQSMERVAVTDHWSLNTDHWTLRTAHLRAATCLWKLSWLAVACSVVPSAVWALEERITDLSASVEVAPVFRLSLDRPHLAFGPVTSEKPVILGQGGFFQEIRCRSNSGQPWHLKAQLVSLKHLERGSDLPPSSVKWNVAEAVGSGEPAGGAGIFQSFSDEPVVMYAGAGDDRRGREVVLRLQYSLTIPPEASAGTYVGEIIFTMTEGL